MPITRLCAKQLRIEDGILETGRAQRLALGLHHQSDECAFGSDPLRWACLELFAVCWYVNTPHIPFLDELSQSSSGLHTAIKRPSPLVFPTLFESYGLSLTHLSMRSSRAGKPRTGLGPETTKYRSIGRRKGDRTKR